MPEAPEGQGDRSEQPSGPAGGDGDRSSTGDPSRKHIRGSALLLSGRVISLGLNFVTQVMAVRYLSKQDFGALAYALPIIGLGVGLNWFGFTRSIGRFAPIYHERGDTARLLGSILLSLLVIVGLGIAVVVVVTGFQAEIQGTLDQDAATMTILAIMIVLMPVEAIDGLAAQLLVAFAGARAIFFRRHVVAPGLKFLSVLGVILFEGDVFMLAKFYVGAGILGLVVYAYMLHHVFKKLGLIDAFRKIRPILPREIVSFTLPLISSDILFFVRITGIVLLIEHWRGVEAVADYRAVTPMARLTTLVHGNFSALFIPIAARLFAQNDHNRIQHLYGQTTVWVTVLTFPIFAVGFGLAEPITVFLFGEEYREAHILMAIMVIGNYAYSVLGFDVATLNVLGRIKEIVIADVLSLILCIGLAWWLVPQEGWCGGSMGGAIAACATLIFYRAANSFLLWRVSGISPFGWKYLKMFFVAGAAGAILAVLQKQFDLDLIVGMILAAVATVALLRACRRILEVENNFPEILKLPGVARILGIRRD